MSLYLDNEVIEKIPTVGVFQSFNARVSIGGYEILRASNAVVRVNVGTAKYPEIGTRYSTPYRKETNVGFSLTRAFVTLYETMLSLGFPVGINYVPGETYDGTGEGRFTMATLLKNLLNAGDNDTREYGALNGKDRPINHYPVKTEAIFSINKDSVLAGSIPDIQNPSIASSDDKTKAYQLAIKVTGAIINTGSISVGSAGDLVTSGPIDAIAERAVWTVDEFSQEDT